MACYSAGQYCVHPTDQPESSYCMTTTRHHALNTLAKPKLWIDYYFCTTGEIWRKQEKTMSRVVAHVNKSRHATKSPTDCFNQWYLQNPSGKLLTWTSSFLSHKPRIAIVELSMLSVTCRRWYELYPSKQTSPHQKLLWNSSNMSTTTMDYHQRSYLIAIVSS